MALRDSACYTLTLGHSPSDPGITTFSSYETGREEVQFARVKEQHAGEAYSAAIHDALSGAKLASVGYDFEKNKKRRLQLHNPDEDVPLEFTGRLSFEWSFQFEGNKYRWSKEVYGKDYICSLDRKPDPRVEICLARGPDSKSTGKLQILHYNIDRFPDEIKDLRGLETLLVASWMCFIDAADDRNGSSPRPTPVTSRSSENHTQLNGERKSSGSSDHHHPSASASTSTAKPVPPPPIPAPPVITPEDFEDPPDPNEIVVGANTDIGEHVAKAIGLLEDPSMLFIVIRSKTPEASRRAMEVSSGVTRFRHKEGLKELHLYVIEEQCGHLPGGQTADRRPSVQNRPGTATIAIYLSTIELPDLKPKPRPNPQAQVQAQAQPQAQGQTQPNRLHATTSPVNPGQPAVLLHPNHANGRSPSPGGLGVGNEAQQGRRTSSGSSKDKNRDRDRGKEREKVKVKDKGKDKDQGKENSSRGGLGRLFGRSSSDR